MKKRLLSFLLILGLSAALSLQAAAANFTDVSTGSWYADAVDTVSARGLMLGTSAQSFSPGGQVTRGMAVTVLWRLSGSPQPDEKSSFPDVADDAYYADSAAWAQQTGIALGLSSGLFAGDQAVTREQLAVLLYRYAQFTGQEVAAGVLDRFPDKDAVHEWARDGVAHAVGIGLITGDGDGLLVPAGQATRAQLAVILQRLLTPAAG